MTEFEALAKEMNVKVTTDTNGLYDGMCGALAAIATDIILSDDAAIFEADWETQKKMIKDRFYDIFPYMA